MSYDEDEKEEIMVIEDYDLVHEKIRNASYWHFIYTNNNLPSNRVQDLFSRRITKKFSQELDCLLPTKESDLIVRNYLISDKNDEYIFLRVSEFPSLIKDLSIRICSNVLEKLSKFDVVDIIWDQEVENFAFQINPQYLDRDVVTAKQFLSCVYKLAKKHLKLKDHSSRIKRGKK
jgi:hypothetical protein